MVTVFTRSPLSPWHQHSLSLRTPQKSCFLMTNRTPLRKLNQLNQEPQMFSQAGAPHLLASIPCSLLPFPLSSEDLCPAQCSWTQVFGSPFSFLILSPTVILSSSLARALACHSDGAFSLPWIHDGNGSCVLGSCLRPGVY